MTAVNVRELRSPQFYNCAPKWWPDWRGETAIVIASGPTANSVPVHQARGRAKVVTINKSWELAPWADVLYGCDEKWWRANRGLKQLTGLKVSQDGSKLIRDFPEIRPVHCDHATDMLQMRKPGYLGWGGNSGFHAINLVAQFGVDRIILVGYDLRLDKGLHWHGKHNQGLNNPTPKNVLRWCRAINDAAPMLASMGIEVFNVSAVSALTDYKKVTFEEALACIKSPTVNDANTLLCGV